MGKKEGGDVYLIKEGKALGLGPLVSNVYSLLAQLEEATLPQPAEAEAGVFSNPADSLNEQLFRMGQVFLVLKVLNISLRFKLTGMRLYNDGLNLFDVGASKKEYFLFMGVFLKTLKIFYIGI